MGQTTPADASSAVRKLYIWEPKRIGPAVRRLGRCRAARRELYVPGRALDEAARLAREAGVAVTIWNLSQSERRIVRRSRQRQESRTR